MNNREINTICNEDVISNLEEEIYSLVCSEQFLAVCEDNSDVFRRICSKAKESLEYSSQRFDQKKLCYLIAIYVLKSGLYCLLEEAYKNGFDFENL